MTGVPPVGTRVRCGYRGDHVGTVLAPDDPRAWAGSLAFPGPEPAPDKVRAHVRRCRAAGQLEDDRAPVLWDFGGIYWDNQLQEVTP